MMLREVGIPSLTINLSDLSMGDYFIVFATKEGNIAKRIIKK